MSRQEAREDIMKQMIMFGNIEIAIDEVVEEVMASEFSERGLPLKKPLLMKFSNGVQAFLMEGGKGTSKTAARELIHRQIKWTFGFRDEIFSASDKKWLKEDANHVVSIIQTIQCQMFNLDKKTLSEENSDAWYFFANAEMEVYGQERKAMNERAEAMIQAIRTASQVANQLEGHQLVEEIKPNARTDIEKQMVQG